MFAFWTRSATVDSPPSPYHRQPVLALFGYDSESVQLKAREINISYQLPGSDQGGMPVIESTPYTYHYGNLETATSEKGLETLERTYRFSGSDYQSNTLTRINVEMEGDILHIYTPTQWPSHVRETVSDTTGIPKRKIVIHRLPFYAPHDEMLLAPSSLSSIAAIA